MITPEEVIEIYSQYDVTITVKEAEEDIKHAMHSNPHYDQLIDLIRGYAQEQAMCDRADGLAAEEHEENYR